MCLGIPGELLEVRDESGLRFGKVRFAAITREVCLECQPDAVAGDFVLVHVGFAIARIDRQEAERAYQVLEQLGQTGELIADQTEPGRMKYLDEYRDRALCERLAAQIAGRARHPWVLMEVCGGQTHSIVRYGIDQLLPPSVELVHGPGCPVCVTSLEMIDRAHAIAEVPDVIFASFGDMLRVPGSRGDLLGLRSRGADVRVVYSPLDAVQLARQNPQRRVVFFGIGFETTAPANAMAVYVAKRQSIANFSMLVSHVLVPPAIAALLQAPGNRVQAFLGPGHVCAVVGTRAYESLAAHYGVPIVVSGFEPVDLLQGILLAVAQLEEGRAEMENPYARTVKREGNRQALALIDEVFEVTDRKWRGIGNIAKSGLRIGAEYRAHDAERLFCVEAIDTEEPATCISGLILRGLARPTDCPAFAGTCTPQSPLGATMVSAEGACAAYYLHGRHLLPVGDVRPRSTSGDTRCTPGAADVPVA